MCEYIILEDFLMVKHIFDNNNGLWYELIGDYYILCLALPTEEERPIGIWGRRHLRYIKEYWKPLYIELLTSGSLNAYLSEIDEKAEDMFIRLVEGFAEKEGITERLKAENQMLWVQRINSVREAVTEIINADLIYTK